MNELQNVRISTYLLDLFLSEQLEDVESNGSRIQCRLLRHKGQMFTILLNV